MSKTMYAVAILLCAQAAHADLGEQLFKLLADDGEAGDQFGEAVAINGTTAIVGVWRNDDACPKNPNCNSGSAYLFDTTTGQQLFKLLPDDGAVEDSFGFSVAINGTTAIVGARWDDDNGNYSGSAYLFDTITGQQLFKLLPNDGAEFDRFGVSVAISGTTAIVGAYLDDDNGFNSGSAYLFDTTTGLQIAKLLPDDGAFNDQFGEAVAINGTTAIVGAWRDVDKGIQSGSAYLFNTTTGAQITKLVPNDGEFDDRFGISVAISGAIAVVGAMVNDDNGFNSGSAYLFDTNTGLQSAKLLPSDGDENDHFGNSVGINDTIAIVGAFRDDNGNGENAGSAYLFDVSDPKNPVEIAKLLPDDGALSDLFGVSVAISGGIAIAGADSDDDNGTESGSAYMFDTTTCLGDLNDDDIVGVGDLLILLAFWGQCAPVCLGDFDGDGDVGVSDLLVMLANWGQCP